MKQEYIATILYGAGGSWARGEDPQKQAERCLRIFKSDWKSLIDFKANKGKEVTVNVIEATGFDSVWWDSRGFWSGDEKIDRPIEQIKLKI